MAYLACIRLLYKNEHFQNESEDTLFMTQDEISSLTTQIFRLLDIPSVDIHFLPYDDKKPTTAIGAFSWREKQIRFFTNNLQTISDSELKHLIWHETLHYAHEIRIAQNNTVLGSIANLETCEFVESQNKDFIKNIFNDIMDYIVEKDIFKNNYCNQDLFPRILSNIEDEFKFVANPSLYINKAHIMLFKLKTLIDFFPTLPNNSVVWTLYNILTLPEKKNVKALVNGLNPAYPAGQAYNICKCFNLISPLYHLDISNDVPKGNLSWDIIPFWVRESGKESVDVLWLTKR
jgi:hypothetical protein